MRFDKRVAERLILISFCLVEVTKTENETINENENHSSVSNTLDYSNVDRRSTFNKGGKKIVEIQQVSILAVIYDHVFLSEIVISTAELHFSIFFMLRIPMARICGIVEGLAKTQRVRKTCLSWHIFVGFQLKR